MARQQPTLNSRRKLIASRHRSRSRHGLTLLELLLILGVIILVLAVLVPQTNISRESARRRMCQANLAQIGMALQQYAELHGFLPAGTQNRIGPIENVAAGYEMSWISQILPQLDASEAFQKLDFSTGAYAKVNEPVRNMRFPFLLCPSDTIGEELPPPTSYAGCHHDVEAPINVDQAGVLFLNSQVKLDAITDGLEHTLFVSEKLFEKGDLGWLSGTRASLRNTGTPLNKTPLARMSESKLAPQPVIDFVGGFSSDHPGGANMCFGDGSVRFTADTISPQVLQMFGNRAASPVEPTNAAPASDTEAENNDAPANEAQPATEPSPTAQP